MINQKDTFETRIRFKFYKKDEFKYLSHLDISRIIVRALSRAELEIKYSQGYNPRPKINFSPPTSLGIVSLAEYADVLLDGGIEENEFKKKVNLKLKPQMQITEAKRIMIKADNLMNDIAISLYGFKLCTPSSGKNLLEEFYEDIEGDLRAKSDFSRSIFDLKIIPDKENSDIILLKLSGYVKIFKEENNEFFKFNNFYSFFGNWLKKYRINIESVEKEELFVVRKNALKTPMEVI
ncbi:MAG: TIGR03936 family radical SAM-associated protein [Actinobacteria bacterium]|nr:TIGR03936 family radical SAM-associated protein [Actinomycetota bacterium]